MQLETFAMFYNELLDCQKYSATNLFIITYWCTSRNMFYEFLDFYI